MTQPTTGDPRALSGMQALLRVFEQMRERPRRRRDERLRPLLLITGPADATRLVTQVLARRCGARDADYGGARAGRGRVDPYARLDADIPQIKEVGALLRRISQELSEHRPRWEPALRFPLLSMALWLQELREEPAHEDLRRDLNAAGADRRRVMRRMIRQRGPVLVPGDRPGDKRAERKDKVATLFTYLDQIAPIGVVVVALLSATAASALDLAAALLAAAFGLVFLVLQAVARTRDLTGRRRYEWFTEQPYLEGRKSDDFLGFAIKAVTQHHEREQVEGLLVAALLADLRRSYRRRWWRRATWARVRYPVLLLDGVAEGTEGYEMIRHIEEIRLDTNLMDPLVVVAALEPAALTGDLDRLLRVPAPADGAVDPRGTEAAWRQHQAGQRRFAALGPSRALRVTIDADDAEMSGSADRFVDPPRSRPLLTHPAIPWLAMAAVLAGSLTVIGVQVVRYCDPRSVWHAGDGECVGITDGSYVFNQRLATVEKLIHDQNDAVRRANKPYVTMVYLGAMSVDPATKGGQPDLLAGIHGELVGMAIAQEEHNSANGEPLLRILLANTGSKFKYADLVAAKIRTRAAQDRTLVAAVGFGQSKEKTRQAIDELGQVALPMIGTTITYDDAGRRTDGSYWPYFFRLAPPDAREAAHAAYWAKNGFLGGLRAKTATVFYDNSPEDLYSRNLADDFAQSFGRRQAPKLPYVNASDVPGLVSRACEHPADLFYFAGRSDEFKAFIHKLSTTSCGGRRTVLASDDVTIYVNDNVVPLSETSTLRLYYTPLAAREAWSPKWAGDRPLPTFYRDYDKTVRELKGNSTVHPSRTHAAVGYDAALTVSSVAQQVYASQGRSLPTAGGMLAELTEPDITAPPLQGASGLLRFGPRLGGHAIADKPVVLVRVRPAVNEQTAGQLEVVAVCGRLTTAELARTPPCPKS
ncbi:MAG TPA: ABC transporter substrate-binding protein [Streptosporangiaceae bacterium]